MAMLTQERLKEMEEEMDRFEQEILVPSNGDAGDVPRMIIGANTYTKVQAQLKMATHPGDEFPPASPPPPSAEKPIHPSVPHVGPTPMEIPLSVLSAPPPPPPTGRPPIMEGQFGGPPPPPPPQPPPPPPPPMSRPSFVPHQLRHRPPMPVRHPMHMPPRGGGMSHFPPPPPPPQQGPPMMGGGGGPPHHMPSPMMMPPQRPYMGPPPGSMYPPHSVDSGNKHESITPPSINIEKPKVVYSAPPTSKNQISEPSKSSHSKSSHSKSSHSSSSGPSHGSNSGPSMSSSVSSSAAVSQYQSSEASQPTSGDGGTEDEANAAETLNESEMTAQQKKEKKEKKRKFIRTAAGQIWEDSTLSEWGPDDFRIFCGDLGNEVTDEVLTRAFSKFPSFVKAKVVRDKRSNKTKGYGFVSFRDPNDFVRAMREMNGKYVGNRPIKLRKSSWKERNIEIVRKKDKEKKRLGLR